MSVTQTLNGSELSTAATDDGVVAELKFTGPDSPPRSDPVLPGHRGTG